MNKQYMQLKTLCSIIEKKKVDDLKILDVTSLTSLADYFIIVTVSNTRLAKALADDLLFELNTSEKETFRKEGYDTGEWILLDYNNVLVHIFYKEAALFYDLEHVWNDAELINIENL